MDSFVGAFVGMAVHISDDRNTIKLHVSINDGNFCIDTQAMTFKIIISEGESKIKHTLSVLERETADDIAKWSLNLEGEITLPQSLHCDHFFEKFLDEGEINDFLKMSENKTVISTEDIKDFIDKSKPSISNLESSSTTNIYKTLIDYLHRSMNLTDRRHDNWRICKKCDRVSYAKDSISMGTSRSERSNVSEQVLEYEVEHYEDTSYKMLSLAISHLFDSFISFMNLYIQKNKLKIIAIGYPVSALKYQMVNKLQYFTWCHLDAFPCFFETTRADIEWVSDSFSRRATRLIGFNNLVRLCIGEKNCVGVDSDCIGLFGLNGYRIGLLEIGNRNSTQKYKFGSDDSENVKRKQEFHKHVSDENSKEKNLANPVTSGFFNDEGYDCVRVNDQKKLCYKTENPLEFDSIKYTNLYGNIINDLLFLSKSFRNTEITFISSTPQGGGVALMRHAHVRMYRLLGIRVNWYVTVPVNRIYEITKKKFHNVLQGVYLQEYDFQTDFNESQGCLSPADDLKKETEKSNSACLNENDKVVYQKWIKQNSDRMWNKTIFKESDIIVLDDHQTSGFAPIIRKINKNVKIIYRSHIQIRGELYLTEEKIKNTWDYISSSFFDQEQPEPEKSPIIDLFLAHPINSLVPSNIPEKLVSYLPPSTDLLDGLNKKMSERICNYYQEIFNKACFDSGCDPINLSETDYLLQVSRFDPSKGLIDCIEMFYEVVNQLEKNSLDSKTKEEQNNQKKLHLILAGHGSVDDPEGTAVFNYLKKYISQKRFENIINRIKLVKVPPLDQCLNLLMTKAKIVLQLSKNEGFEVKVTEALLHEKPVIVSDAGGIPLQVFDGISGFICHNKNEIYEKVLFVLKNYDKMLENVKNVKELGLIHTTPFNIMAWLKIFGKVLKGESGNGEVIYESIIKKYFKGKKKEMLLEKCFRKVI